MRDFATAVAAEKLFTRVLSALEPEAGLLAPIKGVALQQSVYAQPLERPLTDVDIVVHPKVYRRALRRLVSREGFEVVGRGTTGHTLVHAQEALALDLHHQLFPNGMFALRSDGIFERAGWCERGGTRYRTLHELDMYASLLGHFVKGRLGPRNAVHLKDLAFYPRACALDPGVVAEHLSEHGLARAAHTVLPLVYDAHRDTFSKELLAHVRIGPVTRVAATLLVRHREQVDAWRLSRTLWPYAFDRDARRGVINATRHASVGAIRRIVRAPNTPR